jgi:hypothetical protein
MKMQWIVPLMGIALAAVVPAPAWAHTAKYFDSHPAPHGGQKRMAGPYHIELVTKPGEVTVYLTTHAEKDVPTAGGEGKAVVHDASGKEVATIRLAPAGDNIFKGKGNYQLDQDSTVVVFVKMPGQEAWAAEFTPLAPKASAAMHDHDHHDADHDDDEDHDHDAGHDHHHHDADDDHDHDEEGEHHHD